MFTILLTNSPDLCEALRLFLILSFLFFGIGCFLQPKMKAEFERYGLSKQRKIVGSLQLAGAVGLVLGYFVSVVLTVISLGGLALLMLLGVMVRIKIKDPILAILPALTYALLCVFLLLELLPEL
jgi:hypothetical protein